MSHSISTVLAKWITESAAEELSPSLVDAAGNRLLDWLLTALVADSEAASRVAARHASRRGGAGQATLFLTGQSRDSAAQPKKDPTQPASE